MKRPVIVCAFLILVCLAACGKSPSPAPSPSVSGLPASPTPDTQPTSSPSALKELRGKWTGPDVKFPYYYYFINEDTVYMHWDNGRSAEEVSLNYRAYDGYLVITSSSREDESAAAALFHYRYTIKGNTMELSEVTGADQKTLTKIS